MTARRLVAERSKFVVSRQRRDWTQDLGTPLTFALIMQLSEQFTEDRVNLRQSCESRRPARMRHVR